MVLYGALVSYYTNVVVCHSTFSWMMVTLFIVRWTIYARVQAVATNPQEDPMGDLPLPISGSSQQPNEVYPQVSRLIRQH